MTSAHEHLPVIDRVKGVAILLVVAIHAKIGEGSLVHEHVVNRAVPIFLFVFGMMSEMSLGRARAGARTFSSWYASRFRRLFVPIWAAGALWWLAVLATGKPPLPVGAVEAALTALGYSPWIGPSWFVTLVLQLIVLFPALHWAMNEVGPWIMLAAAAAATAFTAYHTLQIADFGLRVIGSNVPPPGWFYVWIFPPRSLWLVVAGMALARLVGPRLSPRATLAAIVSAALVVPACQFVRPEEFLVGPLRVLVTMHLFDVPVALAIVGLAANVPIPGRAAAPLEWCGRHSWGLYLGHVFVFEVAHMLGEFPEAGPGSGRWLYGVFLLASGAVLVAAGNLALRARALAGTGKVA